MAENRQSFVNDISQAEEIACEHGKQNGGMENGEISIATGSEINFDKDERRSSRVFR